MIDNHNIKAKMLNFEVRVLTGWLSDSIRKPAIQNAFLKVNQFCFYVNHLRTEYDVRIHRSIIRLLFRHNFSRNQLHNYLLK